MIWTIHLMIYLYSLNKFYKNYRSEFRALFDFVCWFNSGKIKEHVEIIGGWAALVCLKFDGDRARHATIIKCHWVRQLTVDIF